MLLWFQYQILFFFWGDVSSPTPNQFKFSFGFKSGYQPRAQPAILHIVEIGDKKYFFSLSVVSSQHKLSQHEFDIGSWFPFSLLLTFTAHALPNTCTPAPEKNTKQKILTFFMNLALSESVWSWLSTLSYALYYYPSQFPFIYTSSSNRLLDASLSSSFLQYVMWVLNSASTFSYLCVPEFSTLFLFLSVLFPSFSVKHSITHVLCLQCSQLLSVGR